MSPAILLRDSEGWHHPHTRLARAVDWLYMKSSRWRRADKEAVLLIKNWLNNAAPAISVNELADRLGFSHAKMYNVLKFQATPLSLSEFADICDLFGKDPAEQCQIIFIRCNSSENTKDLLRRLEESADNGRRLSERVKEALDDYHKWEQEDHRA